MFGFLKDDSKKTKECVDMALNVFRLLPQKYAYVINQLNDGIVRNLKKDDAPFTNYVGFQLIPQIIKKYEKRKGAYFVIKGIKVYDTALEAFTEIQFYIGYGLLLGYSTPATKNLQPNITRISVSVYHVEFFENTEYENVKHLFTKDESSIINPNDVYEVELEGKIYYHIQDLEDGDFIGIDKKKNVYRITHDPYTITKLNE